MAAPLAEQERVADWLDSGVVALTGHPDGPALVPPGRAASIARRLAERIAVATAGRVCVDGPALLGERAAFTGATRRGSISAGGGARLLPTLDGTAAVSCVRPDDPALYGALVGEPLGPDPWPSIAAWAATHTGAELADRATLLGLPAAPLRDTAPTVPGELPARDAAGLRVVDFSALWAGPLCSQLLGMAGADIVKVETPHRPDGARRGHAGFYQLLHGGHRSVVVDPASPDGRRRLAQLVQSADIVVEASRPRALRRFGLDADAAVSRGATWISITAAGRDSDRVGFGDDLAAAAGLVARDTADGSPLFCGDAIADPLAGLTAAACALSAPPGGGGMLWDLSMAGLVAATLDGTPSRPADDLAVRRPRHRDLGPAAPPPGADTTALLGPP